VLVNAYGATETTSPTTLMPMGQTFTWSNEPLPRNANGKMMKRLLRAPAAHEPR